jgi:hypothetical protein
MKIINQTCSRQQAEELLSLGVNVKPQFFWVIDEKITDPFIYIGPALTVAELRYLLRNSGYDCQYYDTRKQKDDEYWFEIVELKTMEMIYVPLGVYKTEAKALADALILLIKNKHINAKKLKLPK